MCLGVDAHYPHDGKKTDRKVIGGPWDGQKIGFYDCQEDCVVEDDHGRTVGRYVVQSVQQKNRVIKKVFWDGSYRRTRSEKVAQLPHAERFARLRRALLHSPERVLGQL